MPGWRPLEGVRVLDLSRLLPGPFLTQLLADLGASVTRVEEPGAGDITRHLLDGAIFDALHKGKRSIAIDLRAPGASEVVQKLARGADVLVESFRPGFLDKLGLADDLLGRVNPRLVRVSLVGYPRGAMRDDVGHDINYVALAGILDAQGTPERPTLSSVQVADVGGSLYGAVGVLAALHERDRTGRGRRVEVALSDAALGMFAPHLARGERLERGAWELGGGLPNYSVYACADGKWLALGALEAKFWERFVAATGSDDPAVALATRPRDEWVALLQKAGVPATPVLSPAEALAHPNAARLGAPPTPGSPLTHEASRAPVPALGADTDAVLRDAGYSAEEIASLRARRVIS